MVKLKIMSHIALTFFFPTWKKFKFLDYYDFFRRGVYVLFFKIFSNNF